MKKAACVSISLCLILAVFAGCGTEAGKKSGAPVLPEMSYEDVVFALRQNTDAVFAEWKGTIEDITPSYIVLRTAGSRVILPKVIVRLIQLDWKRHQMLDDLKKIDKSIRAGEKAARPSGQQQAAVPLDAEQLDVNDVKARLAEIEAGRVIVSKHLRDLVEQTFKQYDSELSRYERTIEHYWDKDSSKLSLIMVPVFHFMGAERVLENVSGPVSSVLSLLALLGVLLFASYNIYEKLFVASNLTKLTSGKMAREMEKIHYEIEVLKKEIGTVTLATATAAPQPQPAPANGAAVAGTMRPSPIREFVLYKVLRLLTREEKEAHRTRWVARLKAQGVRGKVLPFVSYAAVQLLYLAGFATALFLGASVVFALPETAFGASSDAGGALLMVLIAVVSLSLTVRIFVKHRLLTSAFRQYRAA